MANSDHRHHDFDGSLENSYFEAGFAKAYWD